MDNIYVNNGTDIIDMTKELLEYVKPFSGLDKDTLFGIKPNLVCSKDPKMGATTHPEIVEGIIKYLNKNNFKNICILESSWVGDNTKKAYDVCGYTDLAQKYDVKLIDLKDDMFIEKEYKGLKIKVYKTVYDIDYLINVPLIKGHCQTNITCALKNLKGLIPDSEKRRFHSLGLHKPIAYLNKIIKQDLIIADAICPDPYFEEGGSPKEINKIVLGFDPVLIDSYASKLLGYKTSEIGYLSLSHSLGVGKLLESNDQIIEMNSFNEKHTTVHKIENKYLNMITEADACSHCYSNLVAALNELYSKNQTQNIVEEISIGQAFKGYEGKSGIGDCTKCFERFVPGCPPSVEDIVDFFINDQIGNHSSST